MTCIYYSFTVYLKNTVVCGRILEVMIAVLHFIMLVFRQVASCKWSSNYLWHLRKPKNRGEKHLKPKNRMHFYACTANRWSALKPKNRRKMKQKPKNRPKTGPKPQNRKQVDPPLAHLLPLALRKRFTSPLVKEHQPPNTLNPRRGVRTQSILCTSQRYTWTLV